MVARIQSLDWGSEQIVFDLLRESAQTLNFPPRPHLFDLHECISLCTNGTHSRNMSRKDHLERLFAACLLHHDAIATEGLPLSHDGTMARMIESAMAVSDGACEATSHYISWLAERDLDEYSRSFHWLGVLLLRIADGHEDDWHAWLEVLDEQWRRDLAEHEDEILGMRIITSYSSLQEASRNYASDKAASPTVESLVERNQLIWLLCLDVEQGQYDPWRRLARTLLPSDDSALGNLRRRLDPPGWARPNPLA